MSLPSIDWLAILGRLTDKIDGRFFIVWLVPFVAILGLVFSLTIMFPPSWLVGSIELHKVTGESRIVASQILLFSSIFLVLYAVFRIMFLGQHWLKDRTDRKNIMEEVIASLADLSTEEAIILGVCLRTNHQTFTAPMASHNIQHLTARGMITATGNVSMTYDLPLMIRGFLWKHLKTHPEALGGELVNDLSNASPEELKAIFNSATGHTY